MRPIGLTAAIAVGLATVAPPAIAQPWRAHPPAAQGRESPPRGYDEPEQEHGREPRRARCNPAPGGNILGAIAGGLLGNGGGARRDRDFGMIGMRGAERGC